ncbi:UNVERIFIED_CONTAM: hypothetical protein FKN15_062644 [Acipenser sinensis]
MASELDEVEDGGCSELARPLHLQYLERALKLDTFLRQTATFFNKNVSSDDSDDGLDMGSSLARSDPCPLLRVKEEPVDPEEEGVEPCGAAEPGVQPETSALNGALHQAPKIDKGSLYNFLKLKKSRKWLKGILLSDDTTDSDSDTDEEEFTLSKEELQDMLRLHRYKKLHQNKFHADRELQQYQYYSAGLLSTHDPFYEQQRHLLGPKKKKIKEEKKLKAKLKKVKKKRKRDEEFLSDGRQYTTKIFAKFSHDTPPPISKKKHLTVEQLTARRRKVWLTIAKKENPKQRGSLTYRFVSDVQAESLSTEPFYEQQRHLLGPKKKKIKEEKKLKAKLKKVKKKRKRDEEFLSDGRQYTTKIFAKFSHDTPPPISKKKHLTVEQLTARRRKVWLTIAKKENPKTFKQKSSARNLVVTNAKKLAHQCMREVRRAAIQAQKNCKETLPRARRLNKEMLLYWKKYEKVEKEHRKRAEKEALEQRKLDEEMREAKRQQRKLNFLITQTELYAHFMSRKRNAESDGIQDEILMKLDDSSAHRQIDIGGGVMVNVSHEDYDSNYYKSEALKNAEEAFQIHQARTRLFDEEAKDSRCASVQAANDASSCFGESYSLANPSIRAGEDIPQPTIFHGKLKGYQLKGMNWLANLYEQGINGILADEMGLGKTVQSIALLAHLAERDNIWGPFLIISPASTLNNWHQEFTRFVPKFKVLPYWGNPHDRKVIRKFWSQVTAVPMDQYCNDRSADYDWRMTRDGGGLTVKQCFLYGAPELASNWVGHRPSFFPESPGGVMALYPRHGWSFIRIPDKETLITDSGKLHTLDLLLTRLKSHGHRVLIYSQMTRMIDLLEEYMVFRKHTYMRLDGSSKISERRDMVADFQSRTDIFVFLLSTRAGGLGINLTAADTVIFYDSDWNPTVDQQAMDRAHRLGQTKQVTVYRLICKGTIEERILQRAKEKSEIQQMVISGGNFKPDTLKPKEVVSLLLDDEELEKKLRMRQGQLGRGGAASRRQEVQQR